ncbi:MAP7 domain-containing protein [Streptomyces sp. NPDC019890]|uniref:MAP7 domain-containing protein n=1 Tax=Streptomyces sp. NPDC019890 TaxID=3365064 RepID=UPI00384C3A76
MDQPARSGGGGQADRVDHVVFRWAGNQGSTGAGIAAVAQSCAPELARQLTQEFAPVLRVEGDDVPTSVVRLRFGNRAVLLRRRSARDERGRRSTVCHALVGPGKQLGAGFCLAIAAVPWADPAWIDEVSGDIDPLSRAALSEAATAARPGLVHGVSYALDALVPLVAQLLRTPEGRVSVLHAELAASVAQAREKRPDAGAEGDTPDPALLALWGLRDIFGTWLPGGWTYATYDTLDSHPTRVTFVRAWLASAQQDPGLTRVAVDERRDDRAARCARDLVGHYRAALRQRPQEPYEPVLRGIREAALLPDEDRYDAIEWALFPDRRPVEPTAAETPAELTRAQPEQGAWQEAERSWRRRQAEQRERDEMAEQRRQLELEKLEQQRRQRELEKLEQQRRQRELERLEQQRRQRELEEQAEQQRQWELEEQRRQEQLRRLEDQEEEEMRQRAARQQPLSPPSPSAPSVHQLSERSAPQQPSGSGQLPTVARRPPPLLQQPPAAERLTDPQPAAPLDPVPSRMSPPAPEGPAEPGRSAQGGPAAGEPRPVEGSLPVSQKVPGDSTTALLEGLTDGGRSHHYDFNPHRSGASTPEPLPHKPDYPPHSSAALIRPAVSPPIADARPLLLRTPPAKLKVHKLPRKLPSRRALSAEDSATLTQELTRLAKREPSSDYMENDVKKKLKTITDEELVGRLRSRTSHYERNLILGALRDIQRSNEEIEALCRVALSSAFLLRDERWIGEVYRQTDDEWHFWAACWLFRWLFRPLLEKHAQDTGRVLQELVTGSDPVGWRVVHELIFCADDEEFAALPRTVLEPVIKELWQRSDLAVGPGGP